MKAHLDFETRGVVDLKRTGIYRYAEDPQTSVLLFAYRFDNGPVQGWRPGWSEPNDLLNHVACGGTVVAHNALFERIIWNTVLRRIPGCESYPRLSIWQMDDTMARALAVHLPPDLDSLAQVLELKAQKDSEGHRLMMKMCKPRKAKKGEAPGLYWHETPEELERLGLYCQRDVLAECEVDERLPPLSDDERKLWELDQKINDRGVALDVSTIEKIVAVLDVAAGRANARMCELTGGAVNKVTEAGKLVGWLKNNGVPVDSIAKSEKVDVVDWVNTIGSEEMSDAVDLRFEAGKNSIAKFRRMLEVVCDDGRARGLLRYHMASTGRWGGALVQPQNLPRVDQEEELPDVLGAIDILA